MRLHNKYIMLSTESMEKIKAGKESEIPENELELAKDWYENLKASQGKKEKPKKEVKKEIVEDKKEQEDLKDKE